MRHLKIENKLINDESNAFVIAEIGHNHQGNIDTAIKMIKSAADSGVDAVKFQKRNNTKLFTPDAYNKSYDSENSFGKTYGLHREFLEFSHEDYKQCIAVSRENSVIFFATPFDFESAIFLKELDLPVYKIASGDLSNTPLIEFVASFEKPMILSTGGSNYEMIHRAVSSIKKYHNNFAILQCTSSYPAQFEQLNLNVIKKLREMYPENIIGFSGHDNGIAMSIAAYTLGARIIEKHFTLNRTLKGTDHAFSLEPQGMGKLVRDLRRTRIALGDGEKKIYESELEPIRKMGKMIVAAKTLPFGHVINRNDLEFRSPALGLQPFLWEQLIGKKVINQINEYESITFEDLN